MAMALKLGLKRNGLLMTGLGWIGRKLPGLV